MSQSRVTFEYIGMGKLEYTTDSIPNWVSRPDEYSSIIDYDVIHRMNEFQSSNMYFWHNESVKNVNSSYQNTYCSIITMTLFITMPLHENVASMDNGHTEPLSCMFSIMWYKSQSRFQILPHYNQVWGFPLRMRDSEIARQAFGAFFNIRSEDCVCSTNN